MVKVYIESGGYAECVATVLDEWTYMALLPAFQQLAWDRNGILTESVVDDTEFEPESVFIVKSEDESTFDMDRYMMYGVHLKREKAEAEMRELMEDPANKDLTFFISEKSCR